MFLLWLRVAAILYAGASIAIFPAVLHNRERWKSACRPLGRPGIPLPLCFGRRNARPCASLGAGRIARSRVAARPGDRRLCSSSCGGSTGPCRLASSPCPSPSSSSLSRRWAMSSSFSVLRRAHELAGRACCRACMAAYAALGFSIAGFRHVPRSRSAASKAKPKPGSVPSGRNRSNGCPRSTPWSASPTPRCCSDFHA